MDDEKEDSFNDYDCHCRGDFFHGFSESESRKGHPPGSLTRRQTNSEVFATPPICDVVVDDYDDDNDGCGRLWPNRLWPSLFDGLCPIRFWPKKSDRLWPTSTDRLWPKLEWLALAKPTVARITFKCLGQLKKTRNTKKPGNKMKKKENNTIGVGETIQSVFLRENVAGLRQATFSRRCGLCPFRVGFGVWGLGFWCLGFGV